MPRENEKNSRVKFPVLCLAHREKFRNYDCDVELIVKKFNPGDRLIEAAAKDTQWAWDISLNRSMRHLTPIR
jgi:hypothetical protein